MIDWLKGNRSTNMPIVGVLIHALLHCRREQEYDCSSHQLTTQMNKSLSPSYFIVVHFIQCFSLARSMVCIQLASISAKLGLPDGMLRSDPAIQACLFHTSYVFRICFYTSAFASAENRNYLLHFRQRWWVALFFVCFLITKDIVGFSYPVGNT